MVEYKQKWSESQADLQQQLKQAKKVRKNTVLDSCWPQTLMNFDLPGSSRAPAREGEGGGRDEGTLRCCRDGNTGQGNGRRKGK